MSELLPSETGGGRHSIGVASVIYIQDASDGLWYTAGMSIDPTSGLYMWSTGGPVDLPDKTVNISNRVIGSAFWVADPLGTWHQFNLTRAFDAGEDTPFYQWTDTTQVSTAPRVHSIRPAWRADDGIYMTDTGGYQIHKLGTVTGIWSELNQGYSFPL